MDRLKLTNNFYLDEFIPQKQYDHFGARARHLVRPEIIKIAQKLRDLAGVPLYANDWAAGGSFQYRGYRPCDLLIGSPVSYHKMGMAIDLVSGSKSPAQLLKIIQENAGAFYRLGLRRCEDPKITKTWLHIDMGITGHVNRTTNGNTKGNTKAEPVIKVFNPGKF